MKLIGNEGVQSLQDLNDEWQETLDGIGELGLAISAFLADYLQPLVNFLNETVGAINTGNRFRSLQKDVAGTDVGAELDNRIEALRTQNKAEATKQGFSKTTSDGLTIAQRKALLKEFGPQNPTKVTIKVTDEDRKRFSTKDRDRGKRASDQLKIEKQIAAEELKQLELETKLLGIGQTKLDAVSLQNNRKYTNCFILAN
mgnify:FL=1